MSTIRVSHPGQPIRRDTLPEPSHYGFMEPAHTATITRRMATPAELAIVAARDSADGYLKALPKPPTIVGVFRNTEREQASRLRGVERSHHKPYTPGSRVGYRAPGQMARVIARAAVVMEAMARHGDDKAAVGRELGMPVKAVSMIVKFARTREVA